MFVSQQVTTTTISSTPSPDQAATQLTALATTSGGGASDDVTAVAEPTDGAVATAGGGSSSSSSAASAPMLPPCRICGEKASGFHYGANTCEACKVLLFAAVRYWPGTDTCLVSTPCIGQLASQIHSPSNVTSTMRRPRRKYKPS